MIEILQLIAGPFIIWLLFYFPQIYNTLYSKKLWKSFWIPPYFSTNLPREKRKKYLIYFHLFILFVIIYASIWSD
jgi:hypothetical protein